MLNYNDGEVRESGITTERVVAGLVIGCLVALILLRRGFRGLNVPGVGSAKIG